MMSQQFNLKASFLICVACLNAALANAEEKKSENSDWAIGLGVGGIHYPHYLGSDENDVLVAPFPYIEYYGERFRIDDDGLAAHIFKSDRVNMNISASSALPVNSEDNRTRQGMEDLNLILEAGPELGVSLIKTGKTEIRLDLPIRAALEFDFEGSPEIAGWTFDPRFQWSRSIHSLELEWQLGALFATDTFNEIYYEVSEEFATSNRQAYDAGGGLVGFRTAFGAKYKTKTWRYFGSIRYFDLHSAENKSSSLITTKDYWSMGIGFAWMFKLPSE